MCPHRSPSYLVCRGPVGGLTAPKIAACDLSSDTVLTQRVSCAQYGLDVLFHRQLLQSPLRVHSSEEADLVFLPIYADLGCAHLHCAPSRTEALESAFNSA